MAEYERPHWEPDDSDEQKSWILETQEADWSARVMFVKGAWLFGLQGVLVDANGTILSVLYPFRFETIELAMERAETVLNDHCSWREWHLMMEIGEVPVRLDMYDTDTTDEISKSFISG